MPAETSAEEVARSSMNAGEFRNILETEERFWWFRGMRAILWHWLDPIMQGLDRPVIAEAGCGTGGFARHFEDRYQRPLLAMDLEAEGLLAARSQGITRLVRANVLSLPFATASLDILLSLDVIVHLERGEEASALAEFLRVLKPGAGTLVLRVAALDALHSRHSLFTWERQRFTRARLIRALETAGFEVQRSGYCNALLLPVAWFKFRVWEPLTRAKPASGLRPPPEWLNWLLYQPLRLEAWWFRNGYSFPLGQSLLCVAVRKPAEAASMKV